MMVVSSFMCTRCGEPTIPVVRSKGLRENGHLKKLYCIHCKDTINSVEINMVYTKEMFEAEYKAGNFDENGMRKKPYKQLLKEIGYESHR